jgi:hypothetical protein
MEEQEQKFRKSVILLDIMDIKLENKLKSKKINQRQYKRLKNILNNYWIYVFDFLHTEEENKFFHDNFNGGKFFSS